MSGPKHNNRSKEPDRPGRHRPLSEKLIAMRNPKYLAAALRYNQQTAVYPAASRPDSPPDVPDPVPEPAQPEPILKSRQPGPIPALVSGHGPTTERKPTKAQLQQLNEAHYSKTMPTLRKNQVP